MNRLENKTAIIVGAGQYPGQTVGNGRAMSLLFAREGARVMLVDRSLDAALETKALIDGEGGTSFAFRADITSEDDCRGIAERCVAEYGKIDILVNNVGIGDEDNAPDKIAADAWNRIFDVNLKGMLFTCRYVIPVMEKQGGGSIINISSAAAVCTFDLIAYKVSKAGVNALTHQLAMRYAKKGIRVNALMLGLLNTPMAVDKVAKMFGISRDEWAAVRDKLVPLKGGMGEAWDTAHAALFLASDEAKFITAVVLPVDGGQSSRIG